VIKYEAGVSRNGRKTYHDNYRHWRERHATRNGCHKHGATKLDVATKATKSQCEDSSEATLCSWSAISLLNKAFVIKTDRFEAENENEHRNRCGAMGCHGRNSENKAKRQKHCQHAARLEGRHHHQARPHETHKCIEAL
jgi:hypothetical protein